ncbi:MAG: SCP2 sterol-binding domain-containing protein [Thermodesulfobacteriota bacterium]
MERDLLADVFESMPERYRSAEAGPGLRADIGFDVGGRCWTVKVRGNSCEVVPFLEPDRTATVKTAPDEWIRIACGLMDPTVSYLGQRLTVTGDLGVLVEVFGLFDSYSGEGIEVKPPYWFLDTLGPHIRARKDGTILVEGLSCLDLAEKYGTPLFVTSENQFRRNYREMKAAFDQFYEENSCNVMWAIKSNTTMALRRIMNEEGAGGDCFSAGELYATFITGGDPEKMLLNGSNRSRETFRMALEIGLRITLDHLDDLLEVEDLARELDVTARVLIRLKCELPSLGGLRSTFAPGVPVPLEVKALKFGLKFEEALEIVRLAKGLPRVKIEGFHSHIGRDVHLPQHWRGYARDMIRMAARFREDAGVTASIMDLGGGFSEIRDPSGNDLTRLAPSIEEYARETCQGIRDGCLEFNFPHPRLWVEPGRHLVGNTTVLITRVGSVKRTPELGTWVHLDASINHLQAIEHFNGMSYHVAPADRAWDEAVEIVDLVGPNCAGDLIQLKRRVPRFERGDLLVMFDVGAYNQSYANQFNCIPRPAAVLVRGGRAEIIRERESITDVFHRQRMPDWLLRPLPRKTINPDAGGPSHDR